MKAGGKLDKRMAVVARKKCCSLSFVLGSSSRSYSDYGASNYSEEEKDMLKQFYRVLSKKYHPDANPNTDTSKQMQLLNQLKGN